MGTGAATMSRPDAEDTAAARLAAVRIAIQIHMAEHDPNRAWLLAMIDGETRPEDAAAIRLRAGERIAAGQAIEEHPMLPGLARPLRPGGQVLGVAVRDAACNEWVHVRIPGTG